MAPKSNAETASKAEKKAPEKKEKKETKEKKEKVTAPGSRRSGRLAGSEPEKVDEGVKSGNKRTASADKPSEPAPKKAKPAPKSKPEPKSKTEPKSKGKATSKQAQAEVEAEASPSAEPDEPSEGKLKLGDKLPKMVLKDEEGEDVEIGDLGGERGVVLFLYPKANTPGCTNQACGFRDAFDEISELGYDIYGLSRDGPTAQKNWKTKQNLNYKLLCDPDSILIKRLGSFVLPKNTKRSSFIFEKGSGKLIEAKYAVKPADDPTNCLKFIKAHHE